MTELHKAIVKLGGVEIAANSPIVWRLQTGVQPYTAVFSVKTTTWNSSLRSQIGEPISLEITDSRGVTTTIEQLSILHKVPSDGPKRTSFLVADRRWKWPYKLVTRDFNMAKRTGNRTALNTVPVENQITVDQYEYRPYSLQHGARWTAKAAVKSVLLQLEPKWSKIESFPIEGDSENGQFTLQNLSLRDQGDAALARLLSYVPGAEVYVATDGTAVVFDAADLGKTDEFFRTLPPNTWDGEKAEFIERAAIRPKEIVVHYQREVECLLEFADDYSGNTSSNPGKDTPFVENVIQTVDPSTDLYEYDPENDRTDKKTVPPGTWVECKQWLDAMDKIKSSVSWPWTFDTIGTLWLAGDLDGALGGNGREDGIDYDGNSSPRIQSLKHNFRQTFRINRRYVERVRDILPQRVALLDPVTGARAPAAVWGQACVIPTTKGRLMSSRKNPQQSGAYFNFDYLAQQHGDNGDQIIKSAVGPTRVVMLDPDLGVFRLEWVFSPYGTVDAFIPCLLVDGHDQDQVVIRDLSQQETKPMGAGIQIESGSNGIFLKKKMEARVLLSIVPAAPNNERQFHRITVKASDIDKLFTGEFRIQDGKGPTLNVYVPPGEATARFAWKDDHQARQTIGDLLGLNSDDPDDAGLDLEDPNVLPGFELANGENELKAHSRAVAAEMLAAYADNVQGRVATRPPAGGLKLVGNMSGASIHVSAAPSAKVVVMHEFPGQQKPVSRMSLLPDSARHLILGTLPYGSK